MGPNNTNKTTLLNTIADRVHKKGSKYKFSGQVKIDCHLEVSQRNFGNYGAYVMQDDILFPTLTCEEALMFSAKLRYPEKASLQKEKVEEII